MRFNFEDGIGKVGLQLHPLRLMGLGKHFGVQQGLRV